MTGPSPPPLRHPNPIRNHLAALSHLNTHKNPTWIDMKKSPKITQKQLITMIPRIPCKIAGLSLISHQQHIKSKRKRYLRGECTIIREKPHPNLGIESRHSQLWILTYRGGTLLPLLSGRRRGPHLSRWHSRERLVRFNSNRELLQSKSHQWVPLEGQQNSKPDRPSHILPQLITPCWTSLLAAAIQ